MSFLKRLNPFSFLKKIYFYCKRNGLRRTFLRIVSAFRFRARLKKKAYTKAQLEAQRTAAFAKDIRISILVPLYNTPLAFLRAMIESVLAQTYANWELCLCDGSDPSHSEVEAVVLEYAQKDARIRYRRLEKNEGISANTNACASLASGDYLALFDHDDLLHPAALYEVMCAICEQDADVIYTDEVSFVKRISDAYSPNFKPDYSPDTLRSYNYICHLCVFQKALFDAVGGFRPAFDGSQDYDLILRLTERAERIVHIPKILYYWRCHSNSVSYDISAKPYTVTAAKKALAEHLCRLGLTATVEDAQAPTTYRIRYQIEGNPLISIVIPNKDHVETLEKCIRSILERSTYSNYEILIVENNSSEAQTFAYYDKLCAECDRVQLLRYEGECNDSKINNFALAYAKGEQILFLNHAIEIITPAWMEELLMFTQRPDVGAGGMLLCDRKDTVCHAGVILGIGGVAGYAHSGAKRNDLGYLCRLSVAQNLSAVAGAVLVRRAVLDEVGAFDESFSAALSYVDLCMKIRKTGKRLVFTPFAQAACDRRAFQKAQKKASPLSADATRFQSKWADALLAGDPYYNPNLTLEHEDFRMK